MTSFLNICCIAHVRGHRLKSASRGGAISVAIWHAVEGDWQPPLSGPRDRFESTGTRVFRAANGSLSALPQGVSAGRDNWRLEAPEEVARPAFFLVRRLPEDADRGRRDDVADTLEKLCVRAHEGALLQLRESDVLGRVRRSSPSSNASFHARRRRTASPRSRICSALIHAMRSRATSAASSPLLTASWRAARVSDRQRSARGARALPRPSPARPRGGASHRCR